MQSSEFEKAFENNFYLTREWADFCSKATGIKLAEKEISNQKIFLLKKKNISVSNYSDGMSEEMKKQKISFMRVLPQINRNAEKPSVIEYSLFHKKPYEEAARNYNRSFRKALRRGSRHKHTTKIIKGYDEKELKRVYRVYVSQMKRLNSAVFPISFFEHLIKCPSAMLFIIEHENKVMSYAFCFQYKGNLYDSIGGEDPKFFNLHASKKHYDELIKYACSNGLNIHFGIGKSGEGFSIFKETAGAVNYKCERHPNDEKLIQAMAPLLKLRITGSALRLASKKLHKKLIYTAMPFT